MPTCDWRAISLSVVARPPRVGSRSTQQRGVGQRLQHGRTRVCRAALSETMAVSNSSDSRSDITATPCSPSVPETSTASPARLPPIDGQARRCHANAGGADEHAVALALLHHLGVAGDDGHARLARAAAMDSTMRAGRPAQALLEDEAGRQVQRRGARHGHVVDRAVHRQAPMSPPGKNSGEITCPSVAITRRPLPAAAAGAVVALAQVVVVEGAGEQLVDQLRAGAPPAPCVMSTRPCLKSMGRT
jgi:hypothetical protein